MWRRGLCYNFVEILQTDSDNFALVWISLLADMMALVQKAGT